MESIVNVSLNQLQWNQAALSIWHCGLGLLHAQDVALPAFLASAHRVVVLITAILSSNGDEASQRHRDYYRGYQKAHHPLVYFKEQQYQFQCPEEMTVTYLSFPTYHVKYKQPLVLPSETGQTSGIPALPNRTLGSRYNKAACKAFVR